MVRANIEPGQVGRFSIDDADNSLYWDDQLVHTEASVFQLNKNQGRVALLLVVAAIISALAGGVSAAVTVWGTFWKSPSRESQTMTSAAKGAEMALDRMATAVQEIDTKTRSVPSPISSIPTDNGNISASLEQIAKALRSIDESLLLDHNSQPAPHMAPGLKQSPRR